MKFNEIVLQNNENVEDNSEQPHEFPEVPKQRSITGWLLEPTIEKTFMTKLLNVRIVEVITPGKAPEFFIRRGWLLKSFLSRSGRHWFINSIARLSGLCSYPTLHAAVYAYNEKFIKPKKIKPIIRYHS